MGCTPLSRTLSLAPGYLGKDGDGMGKSGQIMCILALLVWIVTMLQELFACYRTIAAVVQPVSSAGCLRKAVAWV